ncbi:hypothetical protein B0A48_07188 [Cryoendolithus antarcticus]|uniref:C2 domain-containing protein n=1 Tax=Cryoendolithus antarcticus TaxID=1507870 RepID=A0A1V8T8B0_9PEZI|nr:hypothetical protein B0A48_07188 [Cryoendolithus antarcticus]
MSPNVDARPVVDGELAEHNTRHADDESHNEKQPEQHSSSTSGVSSNPPSKPEQNNDAAPKSGIEKKKDEKKGDGPAGGYDGTPIPFHQPGYTLKFTIHRASNLPMADVNSLSSDPYVLAELKTDHQTRHKEDPPLRLRTPTIRRSTDPEWNVDWIVANVPSSGFKLKLRLYDEDPADQDDRLGNVHVHVNSLGQHWEGLKEQRYAIEKRTGSKRAYAIRAVATCFRMAEHMHGYLYLSVSMVGPTPEDGQNGRLYTIGPQWWTRHYSPLLGRLANVQDPGNDALEKDHEKSKAKEEEGEGKEKDGKEKGGAKHYDFQANQIQLRGPTPAPLYHRFVEFKGWIKGMFTGHGIQGFLLSKALHHQHYRVYNFDRSTQWGHFESDPGEKVTRQFLDLVHWDQGGRMFTYILTLDALWRFTETGKEFGIDLLSKHTMHSDVSIYIAFSGEFFIRRLKHKDRPPPPEPSESTSQIHPPPHAENPAHPPDEISGGPPKQAEGPRDPAHYELVIDNDSGTYRPNADLLPLLKDYLAANLPGLHIQVLDCNGDKEKMDKMKKAQRERKKREGERIVYKQGSRSSSISSSDESDLEDMAEGESGGGTGHEHGAFGQYARDRVMINNSKWNKVKRDYGGKGRRDSDAADEVEEPSSGGKPEASANVGAS